MCVVNAIIMKDPTMIPVDDLRSVCRCCLSVCKNRVSGNLQDFLGLENAVSDTHHKCASIQVRMRCRHEQETEEFN